MKKTMFFKRILAGGLALLFAIGLLPPVDVFANPQVRLESFIISSASRGIGNTYRLYLNWSRPPAYLGVTSPPPGYTGGNWHGHRATHYEILRFVATTNAAAPGTVIYTHGSWAEAINNFPLVQQNMQSGTIFGYRIVPFHVHNIHLPPAAPIQQRSAAAASDPSFFMTDIEVEASGEGNSLEVRWDRVMFNNEPAFDHYRIYVALQGADPFNIPVNVAEKLAMTNPPLVIVGNQYVLNVNVPQLIPGRLYNISIEPLIGGISRANPGFSAAFSATHGNIGPITLTTNEFVARNVFIRPSLRADSVGMYHLLLNWDAPSADENVQEVQVLALPQGQTVPIVLARLFPAAANNIGFLLIERPSVPTRFYVRVLVDGAWTYSVYEFVPERAQFYPTRPNINWVETSTGPPLQLEVNFDAFMRSPFSAAEGAPSSLIRDPDTVYDVWITDSPEVFDMDPIPPEFMVAEGITPTGFHYGAAVTRPDGNVVRQFTYTQLFSEFVNEHGNRQAIVANRVYYIRIVARRNVPGYQSSEASYATHFVVGDVDIGPPVMQRPPLRIVPENTTMTSLDLAWELRWVEALRLHADDGSLTGEWFSAFGTSGGQVVFDTDVVEPDRWGIRQNVTPFHINPATGRLHTDEAHVRALPWGANQPPLRTQNLERPNVSFQVHVLPLHQLNQLVNTNDPEALAVFKNGLMSNAGAWQTLSYRGLEDAEPGCLTRLATITGLSADTTYAIFFRPVIAGHLPWWPTFITGTTNNERDEIEITPPAPFLTPYEEGDRWLSFTIRPFSTDGSLRYEFFIGESPDRSLAQRVDDEFLRELGWHNYNGTTPSTERFNFRASGLFPETVHFIWARVVVVSNPSVFVESTPITMQTLPLIVPYPPMGLGLAGDFEMNIINLENETEFQRVAPDHMTITFRPLTDEREHMPNDTRLPLTEGLVGSAYNTTILGSPQIDWAYLVHIPDLTPNRAYWVRVRTIFSVERPGPGQRPITEHVNYELQFADNPYFVDAITVFVMPEASAIEIGMNVRMTISEWSTALRFFTQRDDGEFDGDVIAELFPLPERDFEIIYDPVTQTLLFRFRATGVDQWGNRDNQVDQRFISRLIQNRAFYHEINMTNYHGQPVSNRIVELPFSITQALTERDVDFRVVADQTTYTFRPGFVNTPQNVGFGRDSRVRLYISDLDADDMPHPRQYVTQPQNLAVNIANPNNTVILPSLGSQLLAEHTVNRAVAMDFNVGAYVNTPNDADWRRLGTPFDELTGTVATQTTTLGDFAAIVTALPPQFSPDPASRDALFFVNSRIALADMEWFMPDFPINAWQINNLIRAVATNAQSVDVNADIPHAQQTSLANAQMLVPGGDIVLREDALAALVRLYEVRTGRRVTPSSTIETTMFTDIAQATPALQGALLR
ncbi:MAG: hypothetical protein FWB74_00080, partial [Defluviitaleaceae bacterium]|nr:hypothetical protein [Defluviitaleaceae bacterium]